MISVVHFWEQHFVPAAFHDQGIVCVSILVSAHERCWIDSHGDFEALSLFAKQVQSELWWFKLPPVCPTFVLEVLSLRLGG